MAVSAAPPTWIIVVNWNGRHHLEYSLPSLLASGLDRSVRVLVVDNHSDDTTLEYLHGLADPRLRVLSTDENRGWAAGNNAGIRVPKPSGGTWRTWPAADTAAGPPIRIWQRMPHEPPTGSSGS